jgi:hypothetical protein
MGFLDNTGLARLWAHIEALAGKKVDKVSGKSLIADSEITRLASVKTGLEVPSSVPSGTTPQNATVPFKQDSNYYYPITKYDQIIMPDGNRWEGVVSDNLISTIGPISIAQSAWTSVSGGFKYTYSSSAITANQAVVEFLLSSTTQNNQLAPIDWETTNGSLVLTTATKPSGTLEVTIVLCGVSGAVQSAGVSAVNGIMPDSNGNVNTFIYSTTQPEAVEGIIWLKPED